MSEIRGNDLYGIVLILDKTIDTDIIECVKPAEYKKLYLYDKVCIKEYQVSPPEYRCGERAYEETRKQLKKSGYEFSGLGVCPDRD